MCMCVNGVALIEVHSILVYVNTCINNVIRKYMYKYICLCICIHVYVYTRCFLGDMCSYV